jgi:hypothetical protein
MPGLFDQTERAPGECIVSIDEQEIADLYPFLIEVSVDTSREAAAEAMLKLETRRDVDGSWIVQDDARIRPWKRLKIGPRSARRPKRSCAATSGRSRSSSRRTRAPRS